MNLNLERGRGKAVVKQFWAVEENRFQWFSRLLMRNEHRYPIEVDRLPKYSEDKKTEWL